MDFVSFVKKFDIFPKYSTDSRRLTNTGGFLGILSFLTMGVLSFFLVLTGINTPPKQRIVVNSRNFPLKDGNVIDMDHLPKMDIHFDILMHNINCKHLNISITDRIKETDEDVYVKVRKERFDLNGNPIIEEQQSLNKFENYTLESITNESCRLFGALRVDQSEGTMQIVPYFSEEKKYNEDGVNSESKAQKYLSNLNMSHTIDHFGVGLPDTNLFYPLDGHKELQEKEGRMNMLYYIRIIPRAPDFKLYYFSVSSSQTYRSNSSLKYPGVFFSYDVSAIGIEEVKGMPITKIISEIMSIMGGVFAIFTFTDAIFDRLFNEKDEYLPVITI